MGARPTAARLPATTETARTGNDKADRPPGTRVLYISPLKALGVDVERNLRAPLTETTRAELGVPEPGITVGVAVLGDTDPAMRRSLVKTPPDILTTSSRCT